MKDFLGIFIIHLKTSSSRGYGGIFLGTLFHIGVAILVWLNAQNTQFSGYTKPELLTYYLLFCARYGAWMVHSSSGFESNY